MNKVVHKKMQLFILAIIVLIALCLLFINQYNKKLYVRIDNSMEEVMISDVPSNDETIIADNSITKETIKEKTNYINLDKIDIKVKINNNYTNDFIVSTSDIIDIEVLNINYNYDLYYSIQNTEIKTEYKLFNSNLLHNIDTPNKFNLYIKIIVNNKYKEFNLGEFKLYDIIYEHTESNNNIEIGTIYNEDGTIYVNDDNSEYIYDDKEINQNIVIDNIEKEIKEEVIVTEEIEEQNIELKGNIHIVEETDLTDIDITGHIFIDTEENIKIEKDILEDNNVHSIIIQTNNFTINNENYKYEIIEEEVIINNSLNEIVNINEIINNSKIEITEKEELSIIKDESNSSFNLMENSKSNLLLL